MDNIENSLQKIGLSNAESQIYLALLKIGEGKIGEIMKGVSITPSNVHEALERLTRKGLISFIRKNKVKIYKPSPVKSLNRLIEMEKDKVSQKEKSLSELMPQLSEIKREVGIKQDAEIFFEFRGIKSAFQKLLSEKIKGEDYIFFYRSTEENVKVVHNFFLKLDKDNDSYSSFPTKGIFNKDYEKLFKQRKGSKITARFTEHPIPSNINIYADKVLIISFSETPIAFLIQSKEIAQTFKDLFNEVWDLER